MVETLRSTGSGLDPEDSFVEEARNTLADFLEDQDGIKIESDGRGNYFPAESIGSDIAADPMFD